MGENLVLTLAGGRGSGAGAKPPPRAPRRSRQGRGDPEGPRERASRRPRWSSAGTMGAAPRSGGGRASKAEGPSGGEGRKGEPKARSRRPRSEARSEPPTPPKASGGEGAEGCGKGAAGPGPHSTFTCEPERSEKWRASNRASECPPFLGDRGNPAPSFPRLTVSTEEEVSTSRGPGAEGPRAKRATASAASLPLPRKRGAEPPYHFQLTFSSLHGFQTYPSPA